jgi:sarcosine oxidase, subunit beta
VGKVQDFLVIGAGIAGVATARHLARNGCSVELIEAHRPAWGASGRNPGFLWLMTKPAGIAMEFAAAGRRYAEGLSLELPDYGFRACGGLIVYRDEALADVARPFAEDRQAAGLPARFIDGDEARRLCPSLSLHIKGAIWNPLEAHQDTRRLVALLAEEAIAAGARIRHDARVAHLIAKADRCMGVRLEDGGEVLAATTIIAAGPWSNELLEPLGLRIPMMPVRFEAAETAPAPFALGPVICGQALFKFFSTAGRSREEMPSHATESIRPELGFTEQIAQYPDGSLQFGCAYEAGGFDDRPTVAGQAMANAVLSDDIVGFADLPLQRAWAGIVGQTPDGLPVIDARPGIDGLALNAGHFFGNLVGAMSGEMVGETCLGREPPFATGPFSLGRFAGALTPLGQPVR